MIFYETDVQLQSTPRSQSKFKENHGNLLKGTHADLNLKIILVRLALLRNCAGNLNNGKGHR